MGYDRSGRSLRVGTAAGTASEHCLWRAVKRREGLQQAHWGVVMDGLKVPSMTAGLLTVPAG